MNRRMMLAACSCVMLSGCLFQRYLQSMVVSQSLARYWRDVPTHDAAACEAWRADFHIGRDGRWWNVGTPTFLSCEPPELVMTYLGTDGRTGGTGPGTDVVVHVRPDGRLEVRAPFADGGDETVDLASARGKARFDELVAAHCTLLTDGSPWSVIAY